MNSKNSMIEETKDGVYLTLRINANQKESKIEKIDPWRNALMVSISAPPVSGKANLELVRLFERIFPEAKGGIIIVKGQRSGLKKIFMPVSTKAAIDRLGLNE